MLIAARNGDIERLKEFKRLGYDFNVVSEWVSSTHVMLNYTMTSLIIGVKVMLL